MCVYVCVCVRAYVLCFSVCVKERGGSVCLVACVHARARARVCVCVRAIFTSTFPLEIIGIDDWTFNIRD